MRNRKLYCFDLDVISLYQDGGRGRSILFLVSHLLILLPSEGQSLWANQISSTYLNWCRDITTSVFEKQTSAILEIYFRFRFRPFTRNLHIILHQATELCPNRSTHCGNMTSYPFLKMAAATAKYYFRFRICWCHCLQKVKVYLQTKFCWDIKNGGWDIFLWQSKMAWEEVNFF